MPHTGPWLSCRWTGVCALPEVSAGETRGAKSLMGYSSQGSRLWPPRGLPGSLLSAANLCLGCRPEPRVERERKRRIPAPGCEAKGVISEGGDKKAGGLPGLGSRWVTRKQGWTQRPCVLHRRALPGGAASWEGEAIPPAAHEPGEHPAPGAALGWWEMGSSSAAHAGWPAASAPRALCLELSWLLPPRVCVLSTW